MRQKIAELKKQLILEEASQQFDQMSYESVSVSSIAKAAGVSIGTIYGLFENKEGLFKAYIYQEIESAYTIISEQLQNVNDPKEKLYLMTLFHFDHLRQKSEHIKESFHVAPLFDRKLTYQVDSPIHKFIELIASILEECHNKRPFVIEDFLQLAYVYVSIKDSYIERWIFEEIELDNSKVDEILNLFFKGALK
jgi:AcrR family transcriptional regulator